VWDPPVGTLGRGSAGQNAEGAEPRGGALPLRVFRGRDALGFLFYRRLKLLGFTRSTFASHICSTDSIPWVHHSREEGSLDYDGRLACLQV
jgi:hypothetical protein